MRPLYCGWYVVAAAVLIYALVIGSTFAAFGLFVLPVSAEFGLSRAEMNTGIIVLNLGNAMIAPFIGRMLDRVPARRIMVASTVLLGASLMALGLSRSLWLDVGIIALPLAAGVLGSGTISISVMIARWFSAYRGRAMALASIGMALGSIIIAPLVGWLIANEGWRTALLLVGGAIIVLMLSVILSIRESPGPDDIEVPDSPGAKQTQVTAGSPEEVTVPTAGEILRMRLFWVFALAIAMGTGINQGLMISLVPLALDSGLSIMHGASLVSVSGIAGIASMLFLAVMADKVDRTVLLSLLILSGGVPCVVLLVAESYTVFLFTAAVIGLSLAAAAPLYLALLADRFGLAAFGTVRGLTVPVMSLAGAAMVRFIGEVFDRTGSYDAGLWTFLALDVVAAAMMFSTRPKRTEQAA
ncbi:MAG: MFS transporter [Sphingomonadaceae bacterium]|nr:MFS transporter [Sphingomonadaceae bacterium]